jgi:hypothetical protein
MSSLFDLKTSTDQLSDVNKGVNRNAYEQIAPTRDVTGPTAISNGAIHFRWNSSGMKWWCPNKSYLRMRLKLAKSNGVDQLLTADDVAPTMAQFASMFQALEFRINDKVVSKISDFVPQIDILETRISKSKAWIDSVGASSNFLNPDIRARRDDVTADGKEGDSFFSNSSRVQMGYDALTAITITGATSTLTFSLGTLFNTSTQWAIGDQIEIDATATSILSYRVSAVPAGTNTLILNGIVPADLATVVCGFRRIRVLPNPALTNAKNASSYELIWTPPLSIFKLAHALPVGKYELILSPQTASSLPTYLVESLSAAKNLTNFSYSIVDMYLYLNTVEGPREDNLTYFLDLDCTSCQSEGNLKPQFRQENFDVSPSTYALTVAFQDIRAGTDTRFSPTKFKSYIVGPSAGEVGEELKMNRMYVSYAGQNLPSPDADPQFQTTTAIDYTTQRYMESQLYSNCYFSEGGAETLLEWKNRGPYYYFNWARDGSDRSTRVQVNQQFDTAVSTNLDNTRVLLFSHYKQVCAVRIAEGRVVDVTVQDT